MFYCGNSIFFAFSQRAPNCSIVVTVLNKTYVFFDFCFFVLVIVEAAYAKADPWGRPHAAYPVGAFEHTSLTLQKQSLLSKGALDICTRAGPKTLPKKFKNIGTGSRRGATPDRLGAQN